MILTAKDQYTKLFSITLLIILVTIDQLTKKISLDMLSPVNLGPITLEATYNPNSALSLYKGPLLYLTILQTIFVAGIIIFYQKIKNYITNTGFILVLAGGLSNLLDRVINAKKILDGAVIDMINLGNLVTINFADILITLGLLTIFLKKNKKLSDSY